MQINWESFKTTAQSASGVRIKFENLCRQLFMNENLTGNKQVKYLHANPNNPGIETEPIFDETTQQWIGFQAKFFDGTVDYDQIKHSAVETVEHYTGKDGRVDLIYLFSNKPISSVAHGYVETVNLLKGNNIEIQLITDNAILDLVRNKYPYLGLCYFGNYSLDLEWFATRSGYMFDILGERFNRDFNVETDSLMELSLFLHDQQAADYLNTRKLSLLKKAEELYNKGGSNREYLTALLDAVSALPDVDPETLSQFITWEDSVMTEITPFYNKIIEESDALEIKRDELYLISYSNDKSKSDRIAAEQNYWKVVNRLSRLKELLRLPRIISISEREKQLLHTNVLLLYGRAGTGKTQLLASKTKHLLDNNRAALLLAAGIYYSDLPIHEQIMSNLQLDIGFNDLIDIMEAIGERDNCYVPLFVDALNETWNKQLWKNGLPSILDLIDHAPMVKLVLSYRPEYETILFPDVVKDKKEKDEIASIYHSGFENNSGIAVKEFLNHYNIPFTPLEYFGAEMSNPLFLTLYCKTYNGEEVSLPTLYERLILKANNNVLSALKMESKGYSEGDNILRPLISQIASKMVEVNHRAITSFWDEYRIEPAPFIRQLEKENILYCYADKNIEYYYFAYDQMNDYYYAKAVVESYDNKDDLRNYLSQTILKIENGVFNGYSQIGLFVTACALYAEQYGEECIDIIDSLKDKQDQRLIFSSYLDSFQWRDANYISRELLDESLKKYPCKREDLWPMLIGNSVKIHHPLNADFLHAFLSGYKLNKRDCLWTIYINALPAETDNRIVQLVEMYNSGQKLVYKNEKQIELLLTLFGWLLTSSSRWLRDYTSKAMIEILKENFQLCIPMLEKFKGVDDPYVLQRLFGIVFGACCKRSNGDFLTLSEYVYESVFNQEKVYPDILLRDYARLIVERFLAENPDYNGIIIRDKIIPPYNSDPIPEIEDQHYLEKEYDGAMSWLLQSMRFEGMGMYGDFGRYVFQSALRNFEIDDRKMFNYAIYHIVNDLGFSEEYFYTHDRNCGGFVRNTTVKTERIGKKYQWITMYNMLARISDSCKMIDRWNYPAKEEVKFGGAWDPYVRDFDPTLNQNFMVCSDAPVFAKAEEHIARGVANIESTDISNSETQRTWLETTSVFFDELKDTLILSDENGQQWVCLTKYCDTGRKDLNVKKLLIWSWLYAYFVTPEQADSLTACAGKGLSIITDDVASRHHTYTVFNREYPWSPSCKEFEEFAWVDVNLKTGEFETVTETVQVPDLSPIEAFLRKYRGLLDDSEELKDVEVPEIQFKEEIRQYEVEKEIGRILHATTDLLWEEEYDATKEEPISYSFPCAKLIEVMGLRQMVADGFLYDANGKLAAFDTDLTQEIDSVVVRKDILDGFLDKTGMRLVWLVKASKEIHAANYNIEKWSEWEAVFTYERDHVHGNIYRIQQ